MSWVWLGLGAVVVFGAGWAACAWWHRDDFVLGLFLGAAWQRRRR